jgi:hypothetical protein
MLRKPQCQEKEPLLPSKPFVITARYLCGALLLFMQIWLVSRRRVASLACVLTGMNVMYYSIVWTVTGDMSAPICAALLHAAVEVWFGSLKNTAGSSKRR